MIKAYFVAVGLFNIFVHFRQVIYYAINLPLTSPPMHQFLKKNTSIIPLSLTLSCCSLGVLPWLFICSASVCSSWFLNNITSKSTGFYLFLFLLISYLHVLTRALIFILVSASNFSFLFTFAFSVAWISLIVNPSLEWMLSLVSSLTTICFWDCTFIFEFFNWEMFHLCLLHLIKFWCNNG